MHESAQSIAKRKAGDKLEHMFRHMIHHTRHPVVPPMLSTSRSCLDGGNGLAGLGRDVKVLGTGDLRGRGGKDDLDVARVALVGVAVKSVKLRTGYQMLNTHMRPWAR